MIRKAIIGVVLAAVSTSAVAQVHVRGHFRKDGTYVQPHVRSAPNSSKADNWSSKGNVNPHTGRTGTVDPYRLPSYPVYPSYSQPKPQQRYEAPQPPAQRYVQRCYTIFDCSK